MEIYYNKVTRNVIFPALFDAHDRSFDRSFFWGGGMILQRKETYKINHGNFQKCQMIRKNLGKLKYTITK